MNVSGMRWAVRLILAMVLTASASVLGQQQLTLDDALAIAASHSPEIKRLELNIERSRQNLAAQKAAMKSRFSLSINPIAYNHDRVYNDLFTTWNTSEKTQSYGTFMISQPIPWTDGTLSLINRFSWQESYSEYSGNTDKQFSNNLYVSFSQPFFTYNRTKLALNELELDLENTALNYAISKLALERNVTQAFYSVYSNELSLQVSKEEYENQKKSYEIIKNKVDAGISAQEELYQAELNLASSESAMYNQQVALENAKDEFKRLIGMSLDEQIKISTDISHVAVEVDEQKAIQHGIENRMELQQAKINIETAQNSLIQTKASNEFKGSLNLSYGLIGTDPTFQNLYDVPTKNEQVSLSLTIPLWDWGEKRHRIKASESVIQSRELSLENEQLDIRISIRQVCRNLKNLEYQIEIARKNEQNAQLTYDINLERYRNGDLTSMDLNLFQTQLSQKKNGLVSALINYKLELLNLKVQSLWDFRTGKSVVPELDQWVG